MKVFVTKVGNYGRELGGLLKVDKRSEINSSRIFLELQATFIAVASVLDYLFLYLRVDERRDSYKSVGEFLFYFWEKSRKFVRAKI